MAERDLNARPLCAVCCRPVERMTEEVDGDEVVFTGFCVGCWRATVLAAWWVRASRPQMVVVQARDELAAARDARTPPILTDESSPSGVGLKIGLEPPSPGKKR